MHPNCDIKVAYDHSNTHTAKALDGLDATQLLRTDGRKNTPNLRNMTFLDPAGNIVEQFMQTDEGVQKGSLSILKERGVVNDRGQWIIGCSRGTNMFHLCGACNTKPLGPGEHHYAKDTCCCATHYLSEQPDFKAQKGWLAETLEKLRMELILYPKYHCELNYIEMIWGWLKDYHRRTCTYNFKDLERDLPITIEQRLPISYVRRVARYCYRFMDAYRVGLSGAALDYTVKKFKSHRKIPVDATREKLEAEFWAKKRVKTEVKYEGAQRRAVVVVKPAGPGF